jgi:hypothetical protein
VKIQSQWVVTLGKQTNNALKYVRIHVDEFDVI